jgi:hypothetical protein
MNKKRLTLLVVAYLLFIIVFIAADDVVLSFPWKNIYRLSEMKTNEINNLSAVLQFKIDSFNENQDVFSTVEFIGWAFLPSEPVNANKQIKLVFVSEEHRYEVGTDLQERYDLREILLENKVAGYKHGFMTKFSPIQMKNGIYKLYLICFENEATSWAVDTGKKFIKNYRSFSEDDTVPTP